MSNMFCYQCQEAAGGKGCTVNGVCGKTADVAKAQDLLVFVTKGLAVVSNEGRKVGVVDSNVDKYITEVYSRQLQMLTLTGKHLLKELRKL